MKSFSMTYAESLFSLAEDEKLTDKIYEEISALAEIFKENPDYAVLLDSPTLPVSKRIELIDGALGDFSLYVLNFVKILCEKKHTHLLCECSKHYEKLYNSKNNIEKVTAITAVPLSPELKDKLIAKMEKEWNKKIKLETKIDKTILGGIVLRTENSQTDASVRARLDKLRTQLSSHQID